MKKRGPAYRIETARLLLRPWSPGDASVLRVALDRSAESLRPYIPFMKDEPRSLEETCEWLRKLRAEFDLDRSFRYAIFNSAGTDLLGETMLLDRARTGEREIGYWMDIAHAGRGIATEGAAVMTRVAFEVDGVDRVEIRLDPTNRASARIPQKLGFLHEATLRRRIRNAAGEHRDLELWSLFEEDFGASPARQVDARALDALGRRLI